MILYCLNLDILLFQLQPRASSPPSVLPLNQHRNHPNPEKSSPPLSQTHPRKKGKKWETFSISLKINFWLKRWGNINHNVKFITDLFWFQVDSVPSPMANPSKLTKLSKLSTPPQSPKLSKLPIISKLSRPSQTHKLSKVQRLWYPTSLPLRASSQGSDPTLES